MRERKGLKGGIEEMEVKGLEKVEAIVVVVYGKNQTVKTSLPASTPLCYWAHPTPYTNLNPNPSLSLEIFPPFSQQNHSPLLSFLFLLFLLPFLLILFWNGWKIIIGVVSLLL